MGENVPATMDALLARFERAWGELKATLEGLDPPAAGGEGGWSIADHLAHLAAWEMGVAEFLRGRSRAAGMGLSEEAWQLSLDEVNERIFEQNAGLSTVEARQKLDESHEAMLAALSTLSDEDLARNVVDFLPEDQREGAPDHGIVSLIGGNTFWHYEEHIETIRRQFDER